MFPSPGFPLFYWARTRSKPARHRLLQTQVRSIGLSEARRAPNSSTSPAWICARKPWLTNNQSSTSESTVQQCVIGKQLAQWSGDQQDSASIVTNLHVLTMQPCGDSSSSLQLGLWQPYESRAPSANVTSQNAALLTRYPSLLFIFSRILAKMTASHSRLRANQTQESNRRVSSWIHTPS